MHLAGGEQGIRHFLEHLGAPMERWMEDPRNLQINGELIRLLSTAIASAMGEKELPLLMHKRDEFLKTFKNLKMMTSIVINFRKNHFYMCVCIT